MKRFKEYTQELINEAKFYRLPKNAAALGNVKNLIDHLYDKHVHGDDYDPNIMRNIEEFIKEIKKSAKSFKTKEDVDGTVYESVVNEGEVLVFDKLGSYIDELRQEVRDLIHATSDDKWIRALQSIESNVEKLEKSINKHDSKLGAISTNESSINEGKDDFVARHSGTNITLKKGYKHHTEEELTALYTKIGDLVKNDLKVKDVTIVFE
jgi:Skp family chaperone for outer membrane proteins